jgi:hypothetical protein
MFCVCDGAKILNQKRGSTVRTVSALAFVGLISLPGLCMAQAIFNGTWRPDPEIYSSTRKPDVVELANGVYDCQTCTPPYKIKADGHDQAISGNPYYDSIGQRLT